MILVCVDCFVLWATVCVLVVLYVLNADLIEFVWIVDLFSLFWLL